MIGKVQVFTSVRNQPVDAEVELRLSGYYLLNTDHILEMEDESALPTVTTRIRYKFNIYDDRMSEFFFKSGTSLANIVTLSDATANSLKLALSVYEGIQTFDKIANVTATTWYFNVADIVWGENDSTGAYARIWVLTGGHVPTPYIVNHNIDQIIDLADTGTTSTTSTTSTTTTTSTSTTTTTSTSTTTTTTTTIA